MNSFGSGTVPYAIRGGVEGRERLRVLSRIVRASTLDLLKRAGIRPGMRCLDVGCGGGDATVEIAKLVAPGGSVVGIDIDTTKVDIARAEAKSQQIINIDFKVANLEESELPAEFDLAHARFVLQHLRDPKKMLQRIRGALKPGGVAVINDTNFAALFSVPESPIVRRYVELLTETVKRRGGDANIGLRLPALLSETGFENIQINVTQHAGMSGEAKLIGPMTLESVVEAVVAEGVASRSDVEKTVSDLYEFVQDPTTLLSGPRLIEAWAQRSAGST